MRYTRYDYKNNKGDNFIIWLVGIIIFSICIGMLFYNIFLKKNYASDTRNKNESVRSEQNLSDEGEKQFGIIQCGVFKDKQNAEATMNSIDSEATCFIVEEDGSYKLMYGVYTYEEAGKKSENLNNSSVSNFRMKCTLGSESNDKKAESEIIAAYIKVINKLTEKDVKSVNIKQFKSWVNDTAGKVDNKSDETRKLIDEINKLPDEYGKENQKNSLIQLYNILKKYKQK